MMTTQFKKTICNAFERCFMPLVTIQNDQMLEKK